MSETDANITVDLGSRSYPVYVKAGLLDDAAMPVAAATHARRLLLVSHPRLMELHGSRLASILVEAGFELSVAEVPAGEKSKSLAMVATLYRDMAAAGLDRHSCVVALGGGVIGDLAGFAAATWLRGIDVIQVPTTLLAMVDSSIGGKTGVNLPVGKNLVGAFYQPRAVLADPLVLATLPKRDIRSGMAEVIKTGIIADAALFEFVEANADRCRTGESDSMSRCIVDSAACKARVVSADEREGGLRAILNYGHTAGHAVEKAAGYRRLRHGEAVAIGMVAAARIGVTIGVTPSVVAQRIEDLVETMGLPARVPGGIGVDQLLSTMSLDKKAKGGSVKWVMARDIGTVETNVTIPETTVRSVLVGLGASES